MTQAKKPVARKPAAKKPVVVKAKKPEPVKQPPFTFVGDSDLAQLIGEPNAEEVKTLVRKFQNRFNVSLRYVAKFRSFKLYKLEKHVDWITLNDLMKRYDCRVAPVAMPLKPQRPYEINRVY